MSRPRRSLHFVPGGETRRLNKALGLEADALVLDLEDAVAIDAKAEARKAVRGWLDERDFGRRERVVRINALETGLGADDLEATAPARPDAYMIPKVRGAADLEEIDARLRALETRHGFPVGEIALIPIGTETAEGVLDLPAIARAPRVVALAWGGEDLSAALGARRNRNDAGVYLDVFRHARVSTLLAAAAAGVDAIDSVYVDFRDLEGLAAESREAADSGFAGKMTIHPDQIPVVNAAFTPSAEEVASARRLLDAFEAHSREGRGVFALDGEMVDAPHLERARRMLERAG